MSKIFGFAFGLLLSLPSHAGSGGPDLKSGDIIFQSSNSRQSYAIMWASKSLYSHVGLVEVDGDKQFVLEAISKVSRTPLEKWIQRGRLGRYAVYRYDGLSPEKQKAIVHSAKKYLGLDYDLYFTSQNDEIYCSELVYLAYRDEGLSIGKMQKVKELDVNNFVVRKLIKSRWQRHPLCQHSAKTFEICWNRILNDELITPISLSTDPNLQKIWSNYPL